jgi:hypothetical protein
MIIRAKRIYDVDDLSCKVPGIFWELECCHDFYFSLPGMGWFANQIPTSLYLILISLALISSFRVRDYFEKF